MTENPNFISNEEIKKLLQETADKIESVRDEILETIDDNTKETAALIAEVSAFLHTKIEPNQQTIWVNGIGEIVKILKTLGAIQE